MRNSVRNHHIGIHIRIERYVSRGFLPLANPRVRGDFPSKPPRPRRATNARGNLSLSRTLMAGTPNRAFIESYGKNARINIAKFLNVYVQKKLLTLRRAAATEGRFSICCANLRFRFDANCCITLSLDVVASLFFRIFVKL